MGTYSKSNFGEIEGKVGEAVASKWRGKKVLRSSPGKRKKGPSFLQKAAQAKMILSAAKLSPVKDVLDIGFRDKKLTGITGYNAAVRAFINGYAIAGEYPDLEIDYSKMQFSPNNGSVQALSKLKSTLHEESLSIVWKVQINTRNASAEDMIFVVLYNQTTEFYMVDDSAKRIAGMLTVDIDAEPGEIIHAWIFCVSSDYNHTSKTQYLGSYSLEQDPS